MVDVLISTKAAIEAKADMPSLWLGVYLQHLFHLLYHFLEHLGKEDHVVVDAASGCNLRLQCYESSKPVFGPPGKLR